MDGNFVYLKGETIYSADTSGNNITLKKLNGNNITVDLSNFSGSSKNISQLEKITEGGNTGWRILGRNPDNYANIGQQAIDFSFSNSISTTNGASDRFGSGG